MAPLPKARPSARHASIFPSILLVSLGLLLGSLSPAVADNHPLGPVVFIPGILGSKLADESGTIVWGDVAGTLTHFSELAYDQNGSHPLHVAGILDSVGVLGPFKSHQYDRLLESFARIHLIPEQNLFLFAYDWRQSNFDTAKQLAQRVADTPALKDHDFNIVAHSMGGLIAMIYIAQYDKGHHVKRLATLGTPFQGSINAFKAFREGLGSVGNAAVGGLDRVQRVVFSMPAVYELLPTYTYCCILGKPIDPQRRAFGLLDPDVWKQHRWIPQALPPASSGMVWENLQRAASLHHLIETVSGVEILRVAGGLINTNAKVYVDPQTGTPQWQEAEGDGTVVTVSAADGHVAESRAATQLHASIYDDDHVQLDLKRWLTVDDWYKQYAAEGRPQAITLAGSTERPLGPVELLDEDKEPGSYKQSGAMSVLHVVLRDTDGNPLPHVKVGASLTTGVTPKGLAVSQGDGGDYRVRYEVPRQPGSYKVTISIPGVGDFDDFFVSIPSAGH
jgi:pimeloyl-ACP methyl ester carboxylesterase